MSDVKVELHGAALWARIDRPEAGNACGSGVIAGLRGWLQRASDEDVRVAVLTGARGVFCAGADVREAARLADDREALLAFLASGRDLVAAIADAPVPVICAVSGVAYAGGLELMLACDIALAGRSARLGDRHLAAGQIPGWGSSAMLPYAVGPRRAAHLLLTGEDLSAEEALAAGLVTEVVDDDRLEGRAAEVAELIASRPPAAVRRITALLRAGRRELRPALEREWAALREHVADPATLAAARAFGGSGDKR